MPRKIFSILFLVSLTACGKGPKVDACLYYSEEKTLLCTSKDGKDYELDLKIDEQSQKANKFVCLPPRDAEVYFKWCNRN